MIRRTEVAAQDRTAVLVVRAWIEETFGEGQLRARITQTLDVASGTKLETAAGSREEVLHAVEEWLRSFIGSS